MFECRENCGECCGTVPIPTVVWNRNKDKIQKRIIREMYVSEVFVFPITEDLKCCFLAKDNRCAIYGERPDVCRRYGQCDELPCPYFKKDGTRRDKLERIIIQIQIDKTVDRAIEKMGATSELQQEEGCNNAVTTEGKR